MNEAVLKAIEYANTSLPRIPRLAPWAAIVDLGDDRLQFRSAEFVYTLNHRFFIDIFRIVQPFLDGGHTLEQIARSGGPGVQPTTVLFFLKMLRANGLLQEGDVSTALDTQELAQWKRQLQFFARFVPEPIVVHCVLRESRIALLGSNQLRDGIRASLASLGMERIRDVILPTGQNIGLREHVAAKIAEAGPTDLLVVCQESPSFAVFDAVNSVCLESGTRWMRVSVEGAVALMGPSIIPGQTACYTCYDRRVQSNMRAHEGFAEYRQQVCAMGQDVHAEGVLAPLLTVLSGQVALEVARIVTGFVAPTTLGRFYEFNPMLPLTIGHDVLRVPRCPACGQHAVTREAWDLLRIHGERP